MSKKTPMQELIEYTTDLLHTFDSEERVAMAVLDYLKTNKRSLLEKEKEVIIETSINSYTAGYLDNQAKVDDSMNFPEQYYNETFNTKEK